MAVSEGGVMFFFVKQKTAYEMRISDWSSDVCSSDLAIFRYDQKAAIGGQVPAVGGDIDDAVHLAPQHCLIPASAAAPCARESRDRARSEERRVGKGCVIPCSSGWSPYN